LHGFFTARSLIEQLAPDSPEAPVNKHIWTDSPARSTDKRVSERKTINIPARLTWKDQRGMTRFTSAVTRNVSEYGVYVECQSPVSIPLFRLVQFQLERAVRGTDALPVSLKSGRVLSAVYRVSQASTSGRPQCLALRLMVDPKRHVGVDLTDADASIAIAQVAKAASA
jgi:hypothetical protein